MRLSPFFLSLCSFASLLIACGTAVNPDGASASAADTAPTTSTTWCLEVANHPRNGDGTVWTVDVTSGSQLASDAVIRRTAGFYWHGILTEVGSPSDESWSVTSASQKDAGYQAHAESEAGAVDVDVSGHADVGVGLTGTVHVVPASGAEQTDTIVGGGTCPD